jgi:hypothetical protein
MAKVANGMKGQGEHFSPLVRWRLRTEINAHLPRRAISSATLISPER